MKHLIWLILLVGAIACNGGGEGKKMNGQAGTAAIVSDEPKGSFLDPVNPGTSPLISVLTTNYWVFEYYVAEDPEARKGNKGRWFKFNPDGSYESGQWEEQTGYGAWRLNEFEGDLVLSLDNIYDSQDGQWEVQGVNKEQDTMTWVGVNKTKTAGIITKVINLLTKPTKAQFGVEE
ncbi:MAG: hypothetical protein KDD02_02950 [Phaeodactylibacter sp.]|nr:hypothetical protein [Phaeodactylibacter sp.]MCB9303480.1 hypothetical protein [Lewinellaceae bacterium]HQU59441.1 hypothetical protein [Saprospiraceae bacterium]